MKMKIRVLSALLMCMVFSVGVFAQEKKVSEKDLLGNWTFVMEHPMGSESGTCVINQDNGQVIASFDNGMKTSAITEKDGVLTATADAQGYVAYLTFNLDGDKLNCDFDLDIVVLSMVMERVK